MSPCDILTADYGKILDLRLDKDEFFVLGRDRDENKILSLGGPRIYKA